GVLSANCVAIQRSAILSYWMIGSPLLCVSQSPPNPVQKLFPAFGPSCMTPLLSNTAQSVFTHCTICVGPTAISVSGGAQLQPGAPTAIPSKLVPAGAFAAGPDVFCTTGSNCGLIAFAGIRKGALFSRLTIAWPFRPRTGGETS